MPPRITGPLIRALLTEYLKPNETLKLVPHHPHLLGVYLARGMGCVHVFRIKNSGGRVKSATELAGEVDAWLKARGGAA